MDEVIAVLQARRRSKRLPDKILSDLCGRPLISHILDRLQATEGIDRVVLAVPWKDVETLAPLAEEAGAELHAGSSEDVLERFYSAAHRFQAPYLVRVTGDNPLIDTYMLSRCIEECRSGFWDMVGCSGLPLGCSAEVFPSALLDLINRLGTQRHHREHVTAYVYEYEEDFQVLRLSPPRRLRAPGYRLTVDTAEDLTLIRHIYEALYCPGEVIELGEVIDFLRENPKLAALNSHVRQKSWRPRMSSSARIA